MLLNLIKKNKIYILLGLMIFCGIFIYKSIKSPKIKGNLNKLSSPLIIFDFDGTICDNFVLCMNLYNKVAGEFKYKKVLEKDIKELRSMKPYDILKKLEIPKWRLPQLVYRIRKEMRSQIDKTKPINGIKDILKFLKDNNISLVLLTSNNIKNVKIFFDKNDINFFDVICTGVSTFGKAKILNSLKKKIDKSIANDIYYIGDEVRDIIACQKANIKIISVTWGMNDHKILSYHKPNYICNNSKELKYLLNKIISKKV